MKTTIVHQYKIRNVCQCGAIIVAHITNVSDGSSSLKKLNCTVCNAKGWWVRSGKYTVRVNESVYKRLLDTLWALEKQRQKSLDNATSIA